MRYHIEVDGLKVTVDRRNTAGGLLFQVNGEPVPIEIHEVSSGSYLITYLNRCLDGRVYESSGHFLVDLNGTQHEARLLRGTAGAESGLAVDESGRTEIVAPMPGKVVKVMVTPGIEVEARQPLMVIEAMKMQNEMRAPRKGVVVQVAVTEGQAVAAGALLVALE